MRILAYHPGTHDAAAAAYQDYELIAAVSEERLTRQKGFGNGVPWLAIDEVLDIAGWSRRDVDVIASTRALYAPQYLRFPLGKKIRHAIGRWCGKEPEPRRLWVHCRDCGMADALSVFRRDDFLAANSFRPDTAFYFANHHRSHALPALFFTGWDEALVYTADGVGDNVSYSIRSLRDGLLTCHHGDDRQLLAPSIGNSLAYAYGFATVACGFRMVRHEGKLTGMSARGEPALAAEIGRHFRLGDDGLIMAPFRDETDLGATIMDICRGHPPETIAASIQKVAEDVMLASVRFWLQRTGSRHLALSGGLFANVRLNRHLAEHCPLDEVFVYPAMGDEGLPVGAALSFLLERDGLAHWLAQRRGLDHLYLGRDYDGEIDRVLAFDPAIKRIVGAPAETAAARLAAGEVGAIYAGRMEYGPRALGGRSILANPAAPQVHDELNRRLERSEFMPFAPCVLEEDCAAVFDITPVNRRAARFMTITCAVREVWHDRIPAIIHVDGTARPQIVHDRDNPLYAGILRGFRATTGIPVLINTSFNVHEEPIVNTPDEAKRALLDRRVDFLVTNEAVHTL